MVKKLKSGEKIWNIGKTGDEEYLLIQYLEPGPYCRFECSDECVIEGGCGDFFTDTDIVGGIVRDVYEHPERFALERDRHGNPLRIMKEVQESEIMKKDVKMEISIDDRDIFILDEDDDRILVIHPVEWKSITRAWVEIHYGLLHDVKKLKGEEEW